jgi:transcriptional regulator with XRE-family HTH domain
MHEMAKTLGIGHMKKYIDHTMFRDLRRFSGLTRRQAADELSVTVRTIQNWETGGARIPWMDYRMLRIVRGYDLPGKAWEGWEVLKDRIYAPNGRWYDACYLEQMEPVFGMARLWRNDYLRRNRLHLSAVASSLSERLTVLPSFRVAPSPGASVMAADCGCHADTYPAQPSELPSLPPAANRVLPPFKRSGGRK